MSIESMAVALHHSRATGTDKLVMLGIANHDGDGGAWPAVATLARYANVEPRAVKRSIAKLVALGELEREIQGGGTRHTPDHTRPNRYTVKVVCPPECDRSAQHRIDRRLGVAHRTPGGAQDTPPGGAQDTPPVSHRTPEPSLNQTSNPEKSALRSTSPTAGTKCWSCGNVHPTKARYCKDCSGRGFNTPIISCTDESCGLTTRRTFPGQQHFTCADH